MIQEFNLDRLEGDPLAPLSDERYETLLAFFVAASAHGARQRGEATGKKVAFYTVGEGETKEQAMYRVLERATHDAFSQCNELHMDLSWFRAREAHKHVPMPEHLDACFYWGDEKVAGYAIPAAIPADASDPEAYAEVMLDAYKKATGLQEPLTIRQALEMALHL